MVSIERGWTALNVYDGVESGKDERRGTMQEITERQQDVLDAIKRHIREHGVPPSQWELARHVGLADSSAVRMHLKGLEKKGRIQILTKKNRGIRVIEDDVPLVGPVAEVAVGTPIVCDAHIIERVPAAIADRFRPRPDYLLTVRGDSMNLTGVHDGDLVAIQRTGEAKNGDMVVARFGDEVTLKRLMRIDERHIELRPESDNPAHEVMELDLAKHIVQIEGIVVGALIGRPQSSDGKSEGGAFAGRSRCETDA